MSSKRRVPPELDLLILSFPMHFTWEFLQAPLFRNMQNATHLDGIRICLQATVGDMVIALIAFWVASVLAGTRRWAAQPDRRSIAAWLSTGIAVTLAIEFYSTEVTARWLYGASMPRLPLIGTGIAPVAQWIVIPMMVLWYMRRLSPSIDHAFLRQPRQTNRNHIRTENFAYWLSLRRISGRVS